MKALVVLVVLLFATYVCQGEDATLILLKDAAEAVGSYATDYNYKFAACVCKRPLFVNYRATFIHLGLVTLDEVGCQVGKATNFLSVNARVDLP